MNFFRDFSRDAGEFAKTMGWYFGRKGRLAAGQFEGIKGLLVNILKARRGTYQKTFLHGGMIILTVLGTIGGSVLINTYPSSVSAQAITSAASPSSILNDQADITNVDTVTKESAKPRRDIVEYEVKSGDTLSSIAKDYGVDTDSIAYLNNFDADGRILRPGEKVKVPPVTGLVVTVKSGETIESLAKKYGLLSAQAIVDWPYNSFANDEKFTLTAGQTLVIPGGRPPAVVFVAPAPVYRTPDTTPFAGGSGQFVWPVAGIITQYFSSYHPALDIAGPTGVPVVAADSGRVETVLYENYGYGYHVIIDHGNGFKTLYGHLSRISVSPGDSVSRGQMIGLRGNTGRSTGPHLHFEIYRGGVRVNPLGYLK